MSQNIAVVLGATGLIGKNLVQRLLQDAYFSQVVILVRRPVIWQHTKLITRIVDFEKNDAWLSQIPEGTTLFCCIGTTMKQVKGDKILYKKIDYDIPVNAAKVASRLNFKHIVLVSSLGANINSANFYLKLKGEIEQALLAMPFERITIFRPSILMGNRDQPKRIGEQFGEWILKMIQPILCGAFSKFKPIRATVIAQCMLQISKSPSTPQLYLYYNDMMKIINKHSD